VKRFILSQAPGPDSVVRLSGEDYHYLVRVRRLAPGETFPARLPGGGEALVRVLAVEGGVLTGRCAPADAEAAGHVPADAARPPLPPVILFQALPRGPKMDLIVRQAAEGGLAEVVPFASEHSVPRIGGESGGGAEGRVRRWEKIIREARQQSGSPVDTRIRPPLSMDGLFAYWEEIRGRAPGALGLLFHQTPLEQASLHGYLGREPETVVLVIGPEGGFSPAEVSRFLGAGFKPLTIAGTVLRTETAALYGAAAVRIILLENTSWQPKTPPSNGSGFIY
jgi:16S rRNA (uracil1498-N3)-methyltransferase